MKYARSNYQSNFLVDFTYALIIQSVTIGNDIKVVSMGKQIWRHLNSGITKNLKKKFKCSI